MKITPLSDLEMFELLQAAYPEKFPNDENDTWEAAMDFVEQLAGFDDITDLLGRVATLCMPVTSPLSGKTYQCLGTVSIADGQVNMVAAVKREVAA